MNTLKFPSLAEVREPDAAPVPRGPLTRICHVSMGLNTGGLERLLVEFSRLHDETQFELSFVAVGDLGAPAEELRAAGHTVAGCGFPRIGKVELLRRLRRHFLDNGVDIVHTHNTYPHYYAAFAAKLAGVRTLINTQHGRGCGAGWKSPWQFRIANLMANRIVGVSEDSAKLCRSQDPLHARRIECIWNGIDVDKFRFTGPAQTPVAISVARLSPEKDYATLLRAVRYVVDAVPEFQLRLVGDGVERPQLEELTRELDLTRHVEFLGERRDIPQLLSQAGFFVSSSRTEGISLTLLEAMATGLPIVTTAVGGSPEIVVDGVTGTLVPPQDPDRLAVAIVNMLEHHSEWSQIALAARARVETCFDVKRMVREYDELYRRERPPLVSRVESREGRVERKNASTEARR